MSAEAVGPVSWSVDYLEQIFQEEGTDKQSRQPGHSYVHTYSSMLGPWRHTLRSMVEIGIGSLSGKMAANMKYWWWAMQRHHHVDRSPAGTMPRDMAYQPGASLRSWRRYFSRARIIGLDIDGNTVRLANETPGVEAYVVDASVPTQIAANVPHELDLIIDDGDHVWVAQQRTLLNMWPYLALGGYYFIEDVFPADFYNRSLRNRAAYEVMERAGAAFITSDPFGRSSLVKQRKDNKKVPTNPEDEEEDVRPSDVAGLLFLRKPERNKRVNVKSILPRMNGTTVARSTNVQ